MGIALIVPRPVTLTGAHVRLEPLTADHVPALAAAGLDPAIWRWTLEIVRSAEEMRAYVDRALAAQAAGTALPFAVIERSTATAIGSTRYGNIAVEHGRLEIGWTWYAPAWQRTAVNTECKLLLLAHAFDALACERVEFKTDALNARSRAALRRIGAREEGTLRGHAVTTAGRRRDTVYYGLLRADWPAVRAGLEALLARSRDRRID